MPTKTGISHEELRRVNTSALLTWVHYHGPTTQARLTRELGLNRSTIGDLTWQMDGISRGAERPWLMRRVADVDAKTVRVGLQRSIALSRVLQVVPAHDVAAYDSIPLLPSRFQNVTL